MSPWRYIFSSLCFYARVFVVAVLAPLGRLCGIRAERLLLRVLNSLFRPPLNLEHCVSLDRFAANQDSADFFTLCRKVGIYENWFQDRKLLDIGCGVGTHARAVAGLGAAVTGIDIAADYIAHARRATGRAGPGAAAFEVMSVYDLKFPDRTFDAAYSHTVFEHLPDIPGALREIHRVLRPGGKCLISHDAYRARYGAHLSNFIPIPWAQVFFSEAALRAFWHEARRKFSERNRISGEPELLRYNDGFGGVNRLKVSEMETLIRKSEFDVLDILAYGEERFLLNLFPWLSRSPDLYEYLRGSAVFLLQRPL